uniref:Uncharacterized protein n=1 Tax=Clytia hemisphaerica TaxID=252671 RepID=A0A7M5XC45_9CNID
KRKLDNSCYVFDSHRSLCSQELLTADKMLQFLVDGIAYLVEGLCSSLLNSFKANDRLQSSDGTQVPLLGDDSSEGFDQNDNIYVQYDSTDAGNSFSWKANRPSFREEYKQALLCTLSLQFCGLLIGCVIAALMYLDIKTGHAHQGVPWVSLPTSIQRLKLTVQILENLSAQLLPFLVMTITFESALMKRLHLFVWNIAFGFMDTIYRLFLQVYDSYGVSWKNYVTHFLQLIMLYNSYAIAKHFSAHNRIRMIMLTLQFSMQFLFGLMLLDFTYYILVPWYLSLRGVNQALFAIFTPIFGEFVKTLCRLVIREEMFKASER